jgi:hypothetical protein
MAKLTSVPTGDDAEAAPAKKAAAKKAAAPAKKAAKKATGAAKAVQEQPDALDLTEMDLLGAAVSLDDVHDYVNIGWYGKGGSGKTTNLCSMVNIGPGPLFLINAEAGLKKRALERHGIDTSRIRVLPDPESGQRLTFEYMEEVYWQAKARLEKEPGSILGFGWDSVTEIHLMMLHNITEAAVAAAERIGVDRDRWFKDRSDYGDMADQVALLLRRFRDLPCHFGFTALERRDVDNDTGKVVYNPAVTPALQTPLGGIPDLIGHCYVEEEDDGTERYIGHFRPAGKYSGKDRYGVIPPRLVDPTFARIHGYVSGDIDPDEDPVMVEVATKRAKRAGKRRDAEEADEDAGDE